MLLGEYLKNKTNSTGFTTFYDIEINKFKIIKLILKITPQHLKGLDCFHLARRY